MGLLSVKKHFLRIYHFLDSVGRNTPLTICMQHLFLGGSLTTQWSSEASREMKSSKTCHHPGRIWPLICPYRPLVTAEARRFQSLGLSNFTITTYVNQLEYNKAT